MTSAESANALIGKIAAAADDVGALRAQLGATSNRLNSVFRNLANVRNNTEAARGRIVDTDFATEAANATQDQMLTQSASAMLKQSNSLSQLVITLVQ
ncbi:flagellin [Duganella aquatilis]|uniref:flagellin n=1 Tax=Duganella aquatilis TaxID=2666082 RepID=UPI001E5353A3|nr:flagellin [Duganella aquatilis]